MATKPIPTFVYSPNPSKPFTKIPFNICSKPFRSSSSSTSLSRSGSLAIKCINNGNANTSSDKRREELKNYLAGIPDDLPNIHELSGIADELLKCEEIRVLFDGLINNSTKRVEPTKIKKQEVKMKKMKHYINQLETKVAEIEKGLKELSEARALVEEAKHFLQVESGDQNSIKSSETESCESKKVASISAIIDALTDVLLH